LLSPFNLQEIIPTPLQRAASATGPDGRKRRRRRRFLEAGLAFSDGAGDRGGVGRFGNGLLAGGRP